jgi:hypothetical protein
LGEVRSSAAHVERAGVRGLEVALWER